MRIHWLIAVSVAVPAACVAPHRPAQGVTPQFTDRFGCDYQEVTARAEELKSGLAADEQYIPQVGWTVCELLSRNGRPSKIDYLQTESNRSMNWWYQTESNSHLVTLDYKISDECADRMLKAIRTVGKLKAETDPKIRAEIEEQIKREDAEFGEKCGGSPWFVSYVGW